MFIADFHIHSLYARATSKECVPEHLDLWARRKGIHLLGTGDFTHQAWRQQLREKLEPADEGFYCLKEAYRLPGAVAGPTLAPRFVVSGEISSIYKKNGKVRKVHNLILLPSLEAADALSQKLAAIGNIHSDGRPILGLDSRDLLEITLETCEQAAFIPAHIWTPHFSLFGAYSGFDTIEECFEDLTPYIHALETGLSSDPPMNWRISALDRFNLVSNSDAHSPGNLGREANLFTTELTYPAVAQAIAQREGDGLYGTIEFFPEEGKYHNDGHRVCKVCLKPAETIAADGLCPVCGKKITLGVLHRVEELADRPEGYRPSNAKHFESLVPLPEIIGAAVGLGPASKKIKAQYESMLAALGPEFYILRDAPIEEIRRQAGPFISESIRKLRARQVEVFPGYDGEYGKVKMLNQQEMDDIAGQLSLFGGWTEAAEPTKILLPKTIKAPAKTAAAPRPAAPDPVHSPHYGLNHQQWAAVSANDQALAVLAGPGTGKTRTLVYRIAHLVEHCGVAPSQITAVTFTNKAAKEMKERLQAFFGDAKITRALQIGTFHSICLQLLASWKQPATIIDRYEALALAEDISRQFACKLSPKDFLQAISQGKNGGPLPDALPEPAYKAYCQLLQQYQVIDYDDILCNVLAQFADVTSKHPKQLLSFTHLLVDEFQDINDTQYQLISQWSKQSQSVFVIGDPDQAIYGFRGANPQCFAQYQQDFAPVRTIRLVQNYRSTPEIINCALPVIAGNQPLAEPKLQAHKAAGSRVRLLEAKDNWAEGIFIAKEINRLVGGIDMLAAHQGAEMPMQVNGFADIAVLYRTHRQAELLEQCLHKEGIPYVVSGREDYLAEPEARAALAFFRFLCQPADLVALSNVLRQTGFTLTERQPLLAAYQASEKTLSVLAALLETNGSEAAPRLQRQLEAFGPKIKREKPAKLLTAWIDQQILGGIPALEKLVNATLLHKTMAEFLQNVALGKEADLTRSGAKKYTSDAVSLLTLHGSKGLEFPVVFLCGVKDGCIPLQNRLHPTDFEEERRLFYVGVTRAKDQLLLLGGQPVSPFLKTIDSAILQKEQVPPGRKKSQGVQLSLFGEPPKG